ncbi:MAG: hypothetical protein JSV50_11240 [Desulfobacteraceae bacterium]|nr:MAG: hypothetical protein JSV50_11240 [Desulfobacteraceae bacterium]
MLDGTNINERLSAISPTYKIMPVKERNGNLQDRHFNQQFHGEEEESKKKGHEKHIFRPTEMVGGDENKKGLLELQDRKNKRKIRTKRPDHNGQRRRIDVLA